MKESFKVVSVGTNGISLIRKENNRFSFMKDGRKGIFLWRKTQLRKLECFYFLFYFF